MCPKCMLSEDGPRPVYKKKGFFCSNRSKILFNSLVADRIRSHKTFDWFSSHFWRIERATTKRIEITVFTCGRKRYHDEARREACGQSVPPCASRLPHQWHGCRTARSDDRSQCPSACHPQRRPERSRGQLKIKKSITKFKGVRRRTLILLGGLSFASCHCLFFLAASRSIYQSARLSAQSQWRPLPRDY